MWCSTCFNTGPKLSIIFINDICIILLSLNFRLLADDTNICCSGYDINDTCKKLMVNYAVSEWFCVDKLSLNLEKTHFMLYKNCKKPVIKINGNIVERMKVTKLLGIYINERLSWKDQISYISNKLSKSIGILQKVSSVINKENLKNAHSTLILPYLTYCVIAWATHMVHILYLFLLKSKNS